MIGFLLGAGFSKALHEDMPVMSELVQILANADAIPEYVPESIRADLERTLSYLWTNHPWHTQQEYLRNQADYLNLTRDIHKILSECEFSAWKQFFDPVGIRKTWQSRLGQMLSMNSRCTVLSMNYDTLLERFMIGGRGSGRIIYPAPLQRLYAAWSQEREFGGESVPIDIRFVPNLYKLHGSLSWYSLDLLDPNSIVYGPDMDSYYLRPQDPMPGDYDEVLFPVIVPPVADKSPLYANKVIRSQWIGALNSLRMCDELYCIGYSFPKSDLAMQLFLAEACSKVSDIHIVNRGVSPDMDDRVREIFGGSRHIHKDFIGEGCVEHLTDHLDGTGHFRRNNPLFSED